MTRITHAPDGSLMRGLIARIAAEAEEAEKDAAEPPESSPLQQQFAANQRDGKPLMPVRRKVG